MKQLKLTLHLLLFVVATTIAQPKLISKIPVNSKNFTKVGNLLYFTSGDSLFKSDGTNSGTVLIKAGLNKPGKLREINGLLYFETNPVEPLYSWSDFRELNRSNGTASGTIKLFTSTTFIEVVNNTSQYVFFRASAASTGNELYRTDGTVAGTILLRDINPGSGNGATSANTIKGNELFFFAFSPATGTELWKTNGTNAGTVLVRDLNPGSASGVRLVSNRPIITYNNHVYFEGTNGTNGFQPFRTDGTSAGTTVLNNFSRDPGAAGGVSFYTVFNNDLYFSYHPRETSFKSEFNLYRTNGTAAGTTFLRTFGHQYGEDNSLYNFLAFQGKLYFFYNDNAFTNSFWVTNGTPAGTLSLMNPALLDGYIEFMEVVNNQIVFYGAGQGYYYNVYRSNGTSVETAFNFNNPYTDLIVNTSNYLFFPDYAAPYFDGQPSEQSKSQLYQSNVFNKQRVWDLHGISLSGTSNITRFGERIFFKTYNRDSEEIGDRVAKLWIYDPENNITPDIQFSLINAATNTVTSPLVNNQNIVYNSGTQQISITATPTVTAGSVVFRLNGQVVRTENSAPYAIAGDNSAGDYTAWNAPYGVHVLTASLYSGTNGSGTLLQEKSITFKILTPVTSETYTFTLVNADTDLDIRTITHGDNISISELGTTRMNIRANSSRPGIQSMVFEITEGYEGTPFNRTESSAPYSVYGDNSGNYSVHNFIADTRYIVKATSYNQNEGTGIPGIPTQIAFYISGSWSSTVKTRPNPVENRLAVTLENSQAEQAEVAIYDYNGREYYRQNHSILNGEFEVGLENSGLNPGIYYVRISTDTDVKVVPIVKN